ncbi:ATP synthase F0 subunit 8 (mitochondrion) [Rhinopithecus bieti]|uniref:ATP synthase complex subunit 8 n=3 Tax=Rhinopithecus TaxID=542827 RepID=F4YTX3_RHIBE|nr:ATP synthase F0 subunit 8 [Rhinopithecus bieti]YP_006460495.1 ATP synthase F0 subunit 8 [Rhinopithecus strykeri]YP_006460508.1 ATP synthase F0 subunit 8 [Rhinopithecus bieti 2 RL-2012]ADI32823.1 ATP synthase F0 subunit 8 [Rhinopithecus bieti]AFK92030.1 ATP synthase F0 subunit 8 [Rhinopithecus strykeri]AFK92043.1 ATP synthase F0 subunit 8 [Rhinopithecus bieti 2 RL-2012]
MPQLNTSTWFITIMTMLPALYLIMQLKLLNTNYHFSPLQKEVSNTQVFNNSWQLKWTKIYLPHL